MWRCSSPDFINVVSLVMSKFSFHTPVHLYLLLQLKGVTVLSSFEKQSIKDCEKIPSQKNKWHFMSHPGAGFGTTNWCKPGQNPLHHLPWGEDQPLSYTLIPVFIHFVFYLSWKEGKVINLYLPQVNFHVLGGCILKHLYENKLLRSRNTLCFLKCVFTAWDSLLMYFLGEKTPTGPNLVRRWTFPA